MMKGVRRPLVTVVGQDEKGAETRTVLTGTVVGTDPVSDVAVLWVEGEMKPLIKGSTEDLLVGQEVYALGNPLGLEHSLSKGVVAGVARTMKGGGGRPISGVIQTDAAINPGNNGGPLLDSSGYVIGVNNADFSMNGGFSGMGLAVPIEAVERSVTSVILKGFVQQPSMGLLLEPDDVTKTLGLSGVMVREVEAGGPAATAGVKPMRRGIFGDLIVGIDSASVINTMDFFKALENKVPGDAVMLRVQRAQPDVTSEKYDTVNLQVQLGSRIIV
jgi:S1-C subfamily serine protease